MRLWPDSLLGRLVLILFGGLLTAQLLSATLHLQDRGSAVLRGLGLQAAQHIAVSVALLEAMDARERARLAAALDLPPTRLSLDQRWLDGADASSPAQRFRALLGPRLGPDRPLQVRMLQGAKPGPGWQPTSPAGQHPRMARGPRSAGFMVQTRLRDGTVATFRHELPREAFDWPRRLLLTLGLLLAAVLAVSVLAVRWITRPLALLSRAASALGRDIRSPPLAETGPREVREAARAFNEMQRRLGHYLDDRSRMLAAVSHDLKTPLTRLRLRAEMLPDASLREGMQADLDDMQQMVQATLDFMRGIDSSEQATATDLRALLESLAADAHALGQQVELHGSVSAPLALRPLAMRRCLTNLIDNACRYGERAEITLAEDAWGVRIEVRDRGPGIAEDALERVFDPFYRLEVSRARHTGGTGLGLGIARNVARAHGGELTLANADGGGLRATLRLPR